MRAGRFYAVSFASAAALSVTACGGGAGTPTFLPPPPSTLSPTPSPSPSSTGQVQILPQPSAGQFASIGAWTNLYTAQSSQAGRFSSIDSAAASQPSIRYTADGRYEIKLPGEDYASLVHSPTIANPAPNDPFLAFGPDFSRKLTVGYSTSGFRYSALGTWSRPDLDFGFTTDSGVVAFGIPTAAGAIPVSGAAAYSGVVEGLTDAKAFDELSNAWVLLPAGGTVSLNFDFGSGSLGGQMNLSVAGGMNPVSVGTYAFSQTVFSRGSTSYSGTFNTTLPGFNFFNGSFTGPNAEETIGNWAVPFQLNGENHQALGAWMAKHQ